MRREERELKSGECWYDEIGEMEKPRDNLKKFQHCPPQLTPGYTVTRIREVTFLLQRWSIVSKIISKKINALHFVSLLSNISCENNTIGLRRLRTTVVLQIK